MIEVTIPLRTGVDTLRSAKATLDTWFSELNLDEPSEIPDADLEILACYGQAVHDVAQALRTADRSDLDA